MTPEEQNFDDAVRKKIGGYNEQPPEEVWQNIEQKKKKRVIGWIDFLKGYGTLLILVAGFFIAGTWYFLKNNTSDQDLKPQKENQLSGDGAIEIKQSQGTTNHEINTEIQKRNSKEDTNFNSKKMDNPAPISDEAKISNLKNTTIIDADKNRNNISSEGMKNQKLKVEKLLGLNTPHGISNRHHQKSENKYLLQHNKENEIKLNDHTEKSDVTEITNPGIPDEMLTGQKVSLNNRDTFPEIQISSTDSNLHKSAPLAIELMQSNNKDSSQKINREKFGMELTFSPDFVSKKTTADNDLYQLFYTKKKNSESIRNAYSACLKISYHVTKNIMAGIGFQYGVINESFDYVFNSQVVISKMDSIYAFILSPFAPPKPISYYGSVNDTVQVEKSASSKNRYQFFSIPVTIGYSIQLGKFDFGLTGGALVNLFFKQQGTILNPDLQHETDLSNQAANPFKKQASISLLVGLGCEYNISKKMNIVIRPEYLYMLHSITDSSYPIKQSYNTLSIRTGVKYKF